jgi:exosortase/archaeosortase family protein
MKVKIETVVLLLILLPPWPRIILNYIGNETIRWITDSMLNVSRIIIEWTGKHAYIYDKTILLGQKSISLEQPCLGLGVATIVIILIAVTRSKLPNKLLFIPVFLIFFALMNSFRLAITLLYIQTIPVLSATIKVNIHDTITYFMYVVAFGAFIVYLFWFQNLNFQSKNVVTS